MQNNSDAAASLPKVIQGGMGIGVSNWKLARAVSSLGQLGVVSGTALNSVFLRRLQQGDLDGKMRHAMAHCPLQDAVRRICDRYFVEGGKLSQARYRLAAAFSSLSARATIETTIVANFVEVFLAKEGHKGAVGLNLLEKVQLPTLPSLFGAMLAGVDYVLMGAGIPRAIPGVLDHLAALKPVELKLAVEGASAGSDHKVTFDPAEYVSGTRVSIARPRFLAIVSSSALAMTLARKASGHVDGFVVEGSSAGGHNAPPRGGGAPDARGEPVYGPRDVPDLKVIRDLGRPFWLAGSHASPAKLSEALEAGAVGIQVGTAFAFCEESGMREDLKRDVVRQSRAGQVDVLTDSSASPTGMPFKVVDVAGTVSRADVYEKRERVCDLGYLRQPYEREDGTLGYRCPAEPLDAWVAKGGDPADAVGRKCLCNSLMGTIGMGQSLNNGTDEPAIVTAGTDAAGVHRFAAEGNDFYTAAEVLDHILGA